MPALRHEAFSPHANVKRGAQPRTARPVPSGIKPTLEYGSWHAVLSPHAIAERGSQSPMPT